MTVLESAAERDESLSEDVEMIEGVLRLSEIHANDEMTPRVDIEGVDLDLPEEARAAAVANAKHRFLPQFRRTPDAIEGVLDVRTGRSEEPVFVPENMTLDDLFVMFAKSGRRQRCRDGTALHGEHCLGLDQLVRHVGKGVDLLGVVLVNGIEIAHCGEEVVKALR